MSLLLKEVSRVRSGLSARLVDNDDRDGARKVVMLVSCPIKAALIEGIPVSNSATSSSMCMSSLLTQESCAGEYPFHLIRYCFFLHLPKVCSFKILSTSHSGSSSMMSGGS